MRVSSVYGCLDVHGCLEMKCNAFFVKVHSHFWGQTINFIVGIGSFLEQYKFCFVFFVPFTAAKFDPCQIPSSFYVGYIFGVEEKV